MKAGRVKKAARLAGVGAATFLVILGVQALRIARHARHIAGT